MKALKIAPLPAGRPKIDRGPTGLVQAHIDIQLRDECVAEAAARGIFHREIVEWGLKTWLLRVAPKRAAAIGITSADDERVK